MRPGNQTEHRWGDRNHAADRSDPDAFLHAMLAHIPSLGAAGMKWVAGFPENQAKGLPYVSGLLILNDPETGLPLAVMDCTWITAKRTGAATAVAAKHLARPDSKSAGILACDWGSSAPRRCPTARPAPTTRSARTASRPTRSPAPKSSSPAASRT